jgi:hypothetical protein
MGRYGSIRVDTCRYMSIHVDTGRYGSIRVDTGRCEDNTSSGSAKRQRPGKLTVAGFSRLKSSRPASCRPARGRGRGKRPKQCPVVYHYGTVRVLVKT